MRPGPDGGRENRAPEAQSGTPEQGADRTVASRQRSRRLWEKALTIVSVGALTLLSVEGLSSLTFVLGELKSCRIRAERIHTEHDPLLGWINKPNVDIRNIYGPGKHLRTNSQRFRNDVDFPTAVVPGRRRWICSGDSFTFGYGVGNAHCWCALLSARLPNVECVNMGQGGYGVDQAFLWYLRDGVKVEHDVLVFAFITGDFPRMVEVDPTGYPRPLLDIVNRQIVTKNVPVPQPSFMARRLPRYLGALRKLRTQILTADLVGK